MDVLPFPWLCRPIGFLNSPAVSIDDLGGVFVSGEFY
jgi:hypothetical protein